MIALPDPNTISRPYRGLSLQDVAVDLDDTDAVTTYLMGREVYRRTRWLLLRNDARLALVEVRTADTLPLFAPVVELRVLAGPGRTTWLEDATIDVGNATALANAVDRVLSPNVDAYAVQGRYEHVNVIWRPEPVRVTVTEVIPPEPAKLYEMARAAIDFDEDLPPIDLVLDAVDLRELAREHRAPAYLLPCRGSGVDLPGDVAFLDTHPPARQDWLLVGCARSQQFHRHFYGSEAQQVDFCPSLRATDHLIGRVLTKCCMLERGVERHKDVVVVPWGSTLDEVRLALRLLNDLGPVAEDGHLGAARTV
ncbi:hypothetical protein EFK50_13925 [Nocardioides marmoriginsengisoli]|uniref:Uncharacterized protein n=1 Tax=Nocardioides marmoriginsengisoli TaxID=661483 RepID=A0A3N0CHB1_9ACTN|nr:hypothetical protein EFK50_13925 [Nocardioides marmoriginsengisoli]